MKKSFIYLMIALAVVGSVVALTTKADVQADEIDTTTTCQGFMRGLDVPSGEDQEFFEQQREQREEMMQSRLEGRLDEALSQGELTQEQKDLILAKREEIQTRMQEMRDETEAWAEENDIDLEYLGPRCMGGHTGGRFGPK